MKSRGNHKLPAPTNEQQVSAEIPFNLLWIRALDPRTFTPITWSKGRETNIRLRSPCDGIKVNVYRVISRWTGTIELHDEAYAFTDTDAGNHEISTFNYKFDSDGQLVDFDPTPDVSEHTQDIVNIMGGFVCTAGSTIEASNYSFGTESNFVSNGNMWIQKRTGAAAPILPEITAVSKPPAK